VLPAAAAAPAAAPVRVRVHAAVMPAGSVAEPAFGQRVNSQRDEIPNYCDDDDENENAQGQNTPVDAATDAGA
ncbi:MAG: hypothetical protein ACRDN1_03945, partial [Trebonia sp.]